jgi:succinyl-diaminopimelate desuccinylase
MPADIPDSVFKTIDARRDELAELTRQLIGFPTVNPPAGGHATDGRATDGVARRLGASVPAENS